MLRRFLFLAIFVGQAQAGAQNPSGFCAEKFAKIEPDPSGVVAIDQSLFRRLTNRLTQTLSGNLATVLRSEWKAKGTFQEANAYVQDLMDSFLSAETRAEITAGLDRGAPDYIQRLALRLYAKTKEGKLRPKDLLTVRDPPPPTGAKDTTLTYYTKPIVDQAGSKHQVRIRNYIREVDLSSLRATEPVEGFNHAGTLVKIEKVGSGDLFQVVAKKGEIESKELLSAAALKEKLGDPLALFAAPHGKSFKVEIKTRLPDSIPGDLYPKLAGQNFVQKLDVSITPDQLERLVGNSGVSPMQRLIDLKAELLAKPGADSSRIEAVVEVLEAGVRGDKNFLHLEGATRYSRNAFEISIPEKLDGKGVRLQTTVDRDLAAFSANEVYNVNGTFKISPDLVAKGRARAPLDPREQGHWELKVPKPLVEKVVGASAISDSPPLMIEVEDAPPSAEMKQALDRFANTRVTNRGKFQHIQKQKPLEDRKEPRP